MSSLYTDSILRWVADTRRAGTLEDADGVGEVGLGAGEAGTRLAVRFALRLDKDRVETVRYQVFGCGFTIAACAAAADLAEGHTLTEIAAIAPARVEAALDGLPEERGYCAVLAVEALQAAVKSAHNGHHPVATMITAESAQVPRVTVADPTYRRLVDSPAPPGAPPEDRHLFACLLAVASAEPFDTPTALGLSESELADLLQLYFPTITRADLEALSPPITASPPCPDANVLGLLLSYLPDSAGWSPAPSSWLARILASRAAHPGHLWQAMGLFARPELTSAIRRHLPALAAANNQGMRWKRFLFKQLCERANGVMCRTPDCGECSDYAICFSTEDQTTP